MFSRRGTSRCRRASLPCPPPSRRPHLSRRSSTCPGLMGGHYTKAMTCMHSCLCGVRVSRDDPMPHPHHFHTAAFPTLGGLRGTRLRSTNVVPIGAWDVPYSSSHTAHPRDLGLCHTYVHISIHIQRAQHTAAYPIHTDAHGRLGGWLPQGCAVRWGCVRVWQQQRIYNRIHEV